MRHASLLLALCVVPAAAVPVIAATQSDRDAPFLPTPMTAVEAMLDLAEVGPGDSVIDLGSGDGRIAIAAAQRGATALGIEIDPDLVRRARLHARDAGVEQRVRFRGENLFDTPIRGVDVVTLYLLPDLNLRLRPRLLTELAPGARVVSHAFDMADWVPDAHRQAEDRNVYLWVIPAVVGGEWRLTLADGSVHALSFDQRFQRAEGAFDGVAITNVALRGTKLAFGAGAQRFHGIVGEGTIVPDPAGPASAAKGWSASRP
jgi:SAM-dependent methyltransferase